MSLLVWLLLVLLLHSRSSRTRRGWGRGRSIREYLNEEQQQQRKGHQQPAHLGWSLALVDSSVLSSTCFTLYFSGAGRSLALLVFHINTQIRAYIPPGPRPHSTAPAQLTRLSDVPLVRLSPTLSLNLLLLVVLFYYIVSPDPSHSFRGKRGLIPRAPLLCFLFFLLFSPTIYIYTYIYTYSL